ncbi:MAG: transporter [Elusimicrobiota bacterium]
MTLLPYALFFTLILTAASGVHSRVNFIETFKPGVDLSSVQPNKYNLSANIIIGSGGKNRDFFELPFIFTYGAEKKLEAGIRFGMASYGAETGISDLSIAAKYQFFRHAAEQPGVSAEFGFSLPTGDYKRGLGTGGVGILMAWLIQKQIDEITGHFLLGYKVHTENPDKIRMGNELMYTLGAKHKIKKDITIVGEIKGINHGYAYLSGTPLLQTGYQEVYLAPGVEYTLDNEFDFYGGILLGITGNSNNAIIFVGLGF